MSSRVYHGYIGETEVDMYIDRYVNIATAKMNISHKGKHYEIKHKFSLDYSDKEMAIILAGHIIEDNNITDLKAEQVAKALNKRWK